MKPTDFRSFIRMVGGPPCRLLSFRKNSTKLSTLKLDHHHSSGEIYVCFSGEYEKGMSITLGVFCCDMNTKIERPEVKLLWDFWDFTYPFEAIQCSVTCTLDLTKLPRILWFSLVKSTVPNMMSFKHLQSLCQLRANKHHGTQTHWTSKIHIPLN